MKDNNHENDEDIAVVVVENKRHQRLRGHPILYASIGVSQTLLCAGIVFGWASLLPVLRDEANGGSDEDLFTPTQYSKVFTLGAVGNYISTLFFGFLLDHYGPRCTGITASIGFASGLVLCMNSTNYTCLSIGFALLGFSGPGVQMPTLHLANLFAGDNSEGGNGGSAVYMSAQAAAFDGGTAIFAILRALYQSYDLPSSTFLTVYLLVPIWVLFTSIFIWPDDILEKLEEEDDVSVATPPPLVKKQSQKDFVGIGSPYMSPSVRGSIRSLVDNVPEPTSLVNARLSVILKHPAFYSLAIWTSIHILKLNFVVATINDQLVDYDEDTKSKLMDIFGAMLPFGFIALPIVAKMLSTSPFVALQVANTVGILYGWILLQFSNSFWMLTLGVFPFVATSRQLVYSTVFSQIGDIFGFRNYGILLGLCNICVSAFSTIQNPLVDWSETTGSYYPANLILLLLTVPLFGIVYFADPSYTNTALQSCFCFGRRNSNNSPSEKLPLLLKAQREKHYVEDRDNGLKNIKRPGRARGSSDAGLV